jgi:adenine-specific DNA-methyltransferase
MKNDHGQYFTPAGVAAAAVKLLTVPKWGKILEPSSGEGVFLAALSAAGYINVEGVEIDNRLNFGDKFIVHNESFVTRKSNTKYAAIIGNPPYVRWKSLAPAQRNEMKTHPLWGVLFNSLTDYLTVFIANSVEQLEDGGELVFVTHSFWMGTKHTTGLREWLLERGAITDLVTFGETEVFKGVSTAVIVFKYVKGAVAGPVRRKRFTGGRRIPETGLDFSNPEQFLQDTIPAFTTGERWVVATEQEQQVCLALETACTLPAGGVAKLGHYVQIANGMVSGADKAFHFPDEKIGSLTLAEKAALLPVAKARGLELGAAVHISSYINTPAGLTCEQFEQRYPSFVAHMAPFKNKLLTRYSYGRDLPYWEWAFRRSERFLLSNVQKGVVPSKERLTSRTSARFALIGSNVTVTQDVTAFAPLPFTKETVEYIVAYLCLPQITNWVKTKGLMKGGVAEFSEKPLYDVPFRYINWDDPSDVKLHDTVTTVFRDGWVNGDMGAVHASVSELFKNAASRPVTTR